MKPTVILLIGALAVGIVSRASAQSAIQSISLSFPNKAAISISGNPQPLALTALAVNANGGTWTAVTDNSTQLYQVNNYGLSGQALFITAQGVFSTNLGAAGLNLELTAERDAGATGTGLTANLSDGVAHNLVSGIQRGFSRWDLKYRLSAEEDAGAASSISGTVTFTITATGAGS